MEPDLPDEGNKHVWNFCKVLEDYTAQLSTKQSTWCSLPWDPDISVCRPMKTEDIIRNSSMSIRDLETKFQLLSEPQLERIWFVCFTTCINCYVVFSMISKFLNTECSDVVNVFVFCEGINTVVVSEYESYFPNRLILDWCAFNNIWVGLIS